MLWAQSVTQGCLLVYDNVVEIIGWTLKQCQGKIEEIKSCILGDLF